MTESLGQLLFLSEVFIRRGGARHAEAVPVLARQVTRVRNLDNLCHDCQTRLMATMNVSLPDQMKTWVESRTRGGRFSNVSDYVRDLIRRDQLRQETIDEIQTLIDEGLRSGDAREFDMSAFIQNRKSETG